MGCHFHVGSLYSVIYHPTQVNTPALSPARGLYSTRMYLPNYNYNYNYNDGI